MVEEEHTPLNYEIIKKCLELDMNENRRLYQNYLDRNKERFDKMRKHQEELGLPTQDEYVAGLIYELMNIDNGDRFHHPIKMTELVNGTKIISEVKKMSSNRDAFKLHVKEASLKKRLKKKKKEKKKKK